MIETDAHREDGFHHVGDGYRLVARRPGAHRMRVPKGDGFLDVHLGKSTASYAISGSEMGGEIAPPSTFVFLPAGHEQEILATRSGWFATAILVQSRPRPALPGEKVIGLSKPKAIYHAEDPALVGIAQTLVNSWTNGMTLLSERQLDAFASLFRLRVKYLLLSQVSGFQPQANATATRIQDVLDYVECNLADPLPLDKLAEIANLSTYHFARVFRTAMGRSPHQYVVERRLADAKRWLSQSDEPLAAIAHVSGFSSQSDMTDTFKKILGVTPGVVRKNSNQSKTARVGDDFYQDLAHGGDQRVVWFVLVVFKTLRSEYKVMFYIEITVTTCPVGLAQKF